MVVKYILINTDKATETLDKELLASKELLGCLWPGTGNLVPVKKYSMQKQFSRFHHHRMKWPGQTSNYFRTEARTIIITTTTTSISIYCALSMCQAFLRYNLDYPVESSLPLY